jgi:hypothetical protein
MHARAKRLPMLGEIDFRSNGIGFLRLFFAAIVLWSHAYGIGGFGWDPIGHVDDGLIAGMLAVGGFFVLSGFLITRSYETVGNALRFIWHRVLRIFPAFWVCLVVTAFCFAPLAYVHERGTLAGFLAAPESPLTYIARNVLLVIAQPNIRGLLANVPAPFMLNGSLWTLAYEFGCYLAVAALGIVGIIRRTPALVAIASLVLFCSYLGLTWHFAARRYDRARRLLALRLLRLRLGRVSAARPDPHDVVAREPLRGGPRRYALHEGVSLRRDSLRVVPHALRCDAVADSQLRPANGSLVWALHLRVPDSAAAGALSPQRPGLRAIRPDGAGHGAGARGWKLVRYRAAESSDEKLAVT